MKILWLDINSSYSHSSVALPAIHAQAGDIYEWTVVRGTTGDNPTELAKAVAEQRPDVIAATFWLFTHSMQIEVISRAVQLLDNVKIVCGGPEFLGNNECFLRRNTCVTALIRGEGEEALPDFLSVIDNEALWGEIKGLCWISEEDDTYRDNGIAKVKDFSGLRYPEESRFFCWEKPFVQLETARGCFNSCYFCVSGTDSPIRTQSTEQVRARLDNILSHGIKDIRVLDRTFNYDTDRACGMLDLFAEYSGRLRFHLEIHPSLLSDRLKEKLATLPSGLLHLEAGMQSLDSRVLSECGRKGSPDTSVRGLRYLCSLDKIQTHADLIAGLPCYSLDMLCNDIVLLIGIGVDELQVESLKVLPGTQMRILAKEKCLKYSPLPPYEILQTPDMSPSDLRTAMQISRMLDMYYNCITWQCTIRKLVGIDPDFVMKFTRYLQDIMALNSPLSLERRGEILYRYCAGYYPDLLLDVSVAWIVAGCSLKKEPAGNLQRIKYTDPIFTDEENQISIDYGMPDPSHRYYLLTCGEARVLFGFDSRAHHHCPVFKASI